MKRNIIYTICYLALAIAVVTGDESKDEKPSGVRATRSISNLARLLLGGNVPPDHPLVQYPEPIQNAASIAKQSVIAAVPGMNGKRPEFGPMPSYPAVHTPGTPPISSPSQWPQTNQGYNSPPVQQEPQLPVSNSLAYSNSYYSGPGESLQSSTTYPQPQQGQANPTGVNAPGNYYNAPPNSYNAPATAFPTSGNSYDAASVGSGRGFGSSPPSYGNGGGHNGDGGNPFGSGSATGNPAYAPYISPNVHLPQQYSWAQQQPSTPYSSPPQNYQQPSQVNYAQASAPTQGLYNGQTGPYQGSQAPNGYNGPPNYYLNNPQPVFNNQQYPNSPVPPVFPQYPNYPNQPPQNYNPYHGPYNNGHNNGHGQQFPPNHQYPGSHNNNFPVGPGGDNLNNKFNPQGSSNYNPQLQHNNNYPPPPQNNNYPSPPPQNNNYPSPPPNNYNNPYPNYEQGGHENKYHGSRDEHGSHSNDNRNHGYSNQGRPHTSSHNSQSSNYKSKDYNNNRHRGEYSDKYPEGSSKGKGQSSRPSSYSSAHKPSSSYKKSYYDDYPSGKYSSSGKHSGSSGKSQYRASGKGYYNYNKPSSASQNKYSNGPSKTSYRSYNKDSQKYRKNNGDYRRNSFSAKSNMNEQVEDMLGEATTIAFESPVASSLTVADKQHRQQHQHESSPNHPYRESASQQHPKFIQDKIPENDDSGRSGSGYRASTERTEKVEGSGRGFTGAAPTSSWSSYKGERHEAPSGSSRSRYQGRERQLEESVSGREYYGRRPHRAAEGDVAEIHGEKAPEHVLEIPKETHLDNIKQHLPKESGNSEIIPSIAIFQASYVS